MPATAPAPIASQTLSAAHFLVEIDGIATIAFTEVSGLEAAIQTVDIRNGSDPGFRIDPGERRYSNVMLRRGMTADTALWNWMKQGIAADVQRRSVSIILLDENRQPVVRWNLSHAWPCSYSMSPLNANGNDLAIESLEICFENLDRV